MKTPLKKMYIEVYKVSRKRSGLAEAFISEVQANYWNSFNENCATEWALKESPEFGHR